MIQRHRTGGERVKPDSITFTICIRAWARSVDHADFETRAEGVYNQMVAVYRETQDDAIRPTAMTSNALISAWGKSLKKDSAERAAKVLVDMEEFCSPDVFTYNSVIDAYVRKRDIWKALEVLKQLENSASLKPDIVSYNTTLQALSKDSKRGAEAQELLDRMICDGNVEPDRISYTCVINAWGANRTLNEDGAHRAAILFETMLKEYEQGKERLKPDVVTFTSVINASANANGNAEARRRSLRFAITTLELMKQDPRFEKPNQLTYSAMTRACARLASNGEERSRVLAAVFEQCIGEGMLSRMTLDMFKNGVPFHIQANFKVSDKYPVVPAVWCRNVRLADKPAIE